MTTVATEIKSALAAFDRTLRRANATDVTPELVDEQLLRRAVEAIETEFTDQPLVRASLQQTVAETYREIGRYPSAVPLQKAALEARRRVLGGGHPRTLITIGHMGALLLDQGRPGRAVALLAPAEAAEWRAELATWRAGRQPPVVARPVLGEPGGGEVQP